MGKARGLRAACAQPQNASTPGYFETASPPRFDAFGVDLEAPGMLEAAARQIAWRGELILTCGDGSAYASPTALNTVLQFYALKLHHVLYVSDSAESCSRLRRAVPSLACVWSSLINASKPSHGSVCVKKYWDMRFFFYNLRKHYLMRLTSELGLNVLQTDTDVVWFADPYPGLYAGPLARQAFIIQKDLPLANAGVLYARAGAGAGSAWVLRELQARIATFSFHPEAVPRVVPWARPPYFSNADEQTLLNDVLTSSVARRPCYVFATATMEAKAGGAKRAGVKWAETPEGKTKKGLVEAVRAAKALLPGGLTDCGATPSSLLVCAGVHRNFALATFPLAALPPPAAPPPPPSECFAYGHTRYCLPPVPPTPGSASASAAPASVPAPAARAGAPTAAAAAAAGAAGLSDTYAQAPSWLFQHFGFFKGRQAHAAAAPAAKATAREQRRRRRRCHPGGLGSNASEATEPFNTFEALPPSFMLHLAGVRTGAWARRALLRSHGWWHPRADALAAEALGWGRRRGVLMVAAELGASGAAGPAQLDTLVGNLLLLAALLGAPHGASNRLRIPPDGVVAPAFSAAHAAWLRAWAQAARPWLPRSTAASGRRRRPPPAPQPARPPLGPLDWRRRASRRSGGGWRGGSSRVARPRQAGAASWAGARRAAPRRAARSRGTWRRARCEVSGAARGRRPARAGAPST